MTSLFGADWIAEQRWFRAKRRPIDSVTAIDRAILPGVELQILGVAYRDGGASDRYLVPMVGGREPEDGDGGWLAIARGMATDAVVAGDAGQFACSHTGVLADLVPSAADALIALDERRLRVEQTNTSVVLGERLILKLYRHLEDGTNPDPEISAFLTEVGFADTPAVAGAMTYVAEGGEPAAAAMLQEFVTTSGDAWSAMVTLLRDDPAAGLDLAVTVGRVAAAMHAALASRPDHPSFPARAATVAETASWRASAERQLAEAITAVDGELHRRMVAIAPAVRARFADVFGSVTGGTRVSRIHGDLHLGQLLARQDGGFSVIDFEGEPARTLAERRAPGSPLRDVAGLLRSLDYAARTAARHDPVAAEEWLAAARRALLSGYGEVDASEVALLKAFELEKACYEVRYEANNRPDWIDLPVAAVERLAAGAGTAIL